jgi:hypothetical protein
MVAEMRRAGASSVRRIIIELGCEITGAKARVLAKLCKQLKREIQVRRRPTSRAKLAGTAVSVLR